jgi:hypothetical protein
VNKYKNIKSEYKLSESFSSGLERLGFYSEIDKNLYFVSAYDNYKKQLLDKHPALLFHLEKAEKLEATAVYCRNTFEGKGEPLPQLYIYDFTDSLYKDSFKGKLTEIHRKIWSMGDVPLTVLLFNTEIKILDCTVPINAEKEEPGYLIENLSLIGKAHKLYNQHFATKIKTGVFWDHIDNKKKFSFNNSSYDKLIVYLREKVIKKFADSQNKEKKTLIHKLIVQSILIKYLEERQSEENGKITKVFEDNFFMRFGGAKCFCDVLRNRNFFKLCKELNHKDKFNGNIFEWSDEEIKQIADYDLNIMANALDGNSDIDGQLYFWRQYDFNYVPIELISRLYEEFIINYEKTNKDDKGKVYTPAHLARFLTHEALPLEDYNELYKNYKILDPACGSGVFLVIAFKRLVQCWRLSNNMKKPSSGDLKNILSDSIFGIDKDKEAVHLTAFSLCLAICDELSPKEIWDDLQFDDLTEYNIVHQDFFEWKKNNQNHYDTYDLIIGNPPFVRGNDNASVWNLKRKKIEIPQKQLSLKFLCESVDLLKDSALLCLIIKASSLLYNSSSQDFKKALFSNFNIKQILDFTPLGRNNCLWDGADVAAGAVFLRNEQPDTATNILHAVFRRTKTSKEKILFEIDDYDLHFVNRYTAIENPFIWKINLLGGGRIKKIVEKCLENQSIKQLVDENKCEVEEGFIIGKNDKKCPDFMLNMQYIPTKAVTEKGIDFSKLDNINPDETFSKLPGKLTFTNPNIIIKENIGEKTLPVFFNTDMPFSFKRSIIGIYSKTDHDLLKTIFDSIKFHSDICRFLIFATSGKLLINKNTVFLKEDIMNLPIIDKSEQILSEIDKKIISDVNTFMQKFLRNGENSDAVKAVPKNDNRFIENFGQEFSRALNLVYQDGEKKFRLSDIIRFKDNQFIGTIFYYDKKEKVPEIFNLDYGSKDIKELLDFDLTQELSVKRIIKYYRKDKVIFIKPNQKRFWISLNAYRDADKTFADIAAL